jgi:hypothetical protein
MKKKQGRSFTQIKRKCICLVCEKDTIDWAPLNVHTNNLRWLKLHRKELFLSRMAF